VGEGLNEPPNSQGCNQCGIITHKEGGETVLTWNEIHTDGNTPLLLGNAIKKGKASQRKPRHWGQTPDVSRRSGANLHQATQGLPQLANGLVGEGINEPLNSQGCKQCTITTHTHKGERQ
jgi:hypothetical protein